MSDVRSGESSRFTPAHAVDTWWSTVATGDEDVDLSRHEPAQPVTLGGDTSRHCDQARRAQYGGLPLSSGTGQAAVLEEEGVANSLPESGRDTAPRSIGVVPRGRVQLDAANNHFLKVSEMR